MWCCGACLVGRLAVGLGVEGGLELLRAEVVQLAVQSVSVVPVDVVYGQGFDVGEVPQRSDSETVSLALTASFLNSPNTVSAAALSLGVVDRPDRGRESLQSKGFGEPHRRVLTASDYAEFDVKPRNRNWPAPEGFQSNSSA